MYCTVQFKPFALAVTVAATVAVALAIALAVACAGDPHAMSDAARRNEPTNQRS